MGQVAPNLAMLIGEQVSVDSQFSSSYAIACRSVHVSLLMLVV